MGTRQQDAKSYVEQSILKLKKTKEPAGQKYPIGSFVWIGEMPPYMFHFEANRAARVEFTYGHAFGGNDVDSYSLLVRLDSGEWTSISWYQEYQLTLIEDANKIKNFEAEIAAQEKI